MRASLNLLIFNLFAHTARRTCRSSICLLITVLAGITSAQAQAQPAWPDWPAALVTDIAKINAHNPSRIGVYVLDLGSGVSASYQADQRWYLASMVKVPVAMAVLKGIERGDYSLDTPLTLRAGDYVDGAGSTNRKAVGTAITIRTLLEQMIIHSDNTASDMLIDLVGVAEVNAVVKSAVPGAAWRITTLAEVRHRIYGGLVPTAHQLRGQDLIELNRLRADADRMQLLSQLLDTPISQFQLPSLDAAYNAYYATGLNSGQLDAYGVLLAKLADGKVLNAVQTDYLLTLMERVVTGPNRLKAGLPVGTPFAHKTGTQRRRTCDAGLIRLTGTTELGQPRRVVVVACVRDDTSVNRADFALMQVGAALCRSGLLTQGMPHAPFCPRVAGTERLPADPLR